MNNNAKSAAVAAMEVEMPDFDGTGPRRGGRGMGRGAGRGQGFGHIPDSNMVQGFQGHIYEYTREELLERKAALEKEVRWIEERLKEFEPSTNEEN